MKKILPFLLISLFILSGCNNNINTEEHNSYNTSKISTKNNSNDFSNSSNTVAKNNSNIETELSSFSTKIYTPNDEARQNNIRITCSKLNGVVVKSRRNILFL